MKKEDDLITNLDAAMDLSRKIQYKGQVHKALSIAIGSIHAQFEDLSNNGKTADDADIYYVPLLLELSVEITKEIDSMSEELTEMLFNLKPENHN